jgi:methionyl-tRNA formyltransferase
MPRLGTINLHASLLPQYRGAAPINWVVINGEKITGVTTFFIEKEIDTGKIIYSEKVSIDDSDDAGSLHDKLMETGAKLLKQTVESIESVYYPQTDQFSAVLPGTELKTAPKIFKEDCKIDWTAPITQIHDFIRGLSPYPAAWSTLVHTHTNERISLKIFASKPEFCQHTKQTGSISTDEKKFLKIAVHGGYIHLLALQMEGKKRLTVEEFLRGFKNPEDYRLE